MSLLLLITAMVILPTACTRNSASTSVSSPDPQPATVIPYPNPYPAAYPYPDTAQPAPEATSYPAPSISSLVVPTSIPTLVPTPSPMPSNLISQTKLFCSSLGDFLKCEDTILRISFEYPATWGEAEGVLLAGDTGFSYRYVFSELASQLTMTVATGGLSHDFTMGRGGMWTDFAGYGGASSRNPCQSGSGTPPICDVIKPQVAMFMLFPQAKYICDPGPGSFDVPLAFIDIDLPDNPTINGFRFVSPVLSEQETEMFRNRTQEILGTLKAGESKCDSASQTVFDDSVKALIERMKSGLIDADTQANIDQLRHIAQSIDIE